MKLEAWGVGSVKLQVVASLVVTSDQVRPPSLLTCTFSSAPSGPCVPDTVSVVSLVVKSPGVRAEERRAGMASAAAGAAGSMVVDWLSVAPTWADGLIAGDGYVVLEVGGVGSVKLQVVASLVVTSDQVRPPSLLTCTFSPAPSGSCVPDTVSVVSLVVKSPGVPVSRAIARLSATAVAAVVSMVTAWLSVAPTLAAASITRAWEVKLEECVVRPDALPILASLVVTSDQVRPPSLLTCTFSPAPSGSCVPDTVSVVSLVMKSPGVPVSFVIAVMATAAAGAVVLVGGWSWRETALGAVSGARVR